MKPRAIRFALYRLSPLRPFYEGRGFLPPAPRESPDYNLPLFSAPEETAYTIAKSLNDRNPHDRVKICSLAELRERITKHLKSPSQKEPLS